MNSAMPMLLEALFPTVWATLTIHPLTLVVRDHFTYLVCVF